jgi:hypothetical protein
MIWMTFVAHCAESAVFEAEGDVVVGLSSACSIYTNNHAVLKTKSFIQEGRLN